MLRYLNWENFVFTVKKKNAFNAMSLPVRTTLAISCDFQNTVLSLKSFSKSSEITTLFLILRKCTLVYSLIQE